MQIIRHGTAGEVWQGQVWRGAVRHGTAGMARRGPAGHGKVRHGWRGAARLGMARPGTVRLARSGLVWLPTARHDIAQRGSYLPHHKQHHQMTTYTFRNGTRISGVNAQTAGEELARIQNAHGAITAPLVVDEARPTDAPLHPAFEWNDLVAAEQHRQHQARNLIRSVQIIETDDQTSPAYVHIQTTRSYLPTAEVVRRVDLYDDAFRTACSRISEAQYSLEQLKRLAAKNQQPGVETAIINLTAIQKSLTKLSK